MTERDLIELMRMCPTIQAKIWLVNFQMKLGENLI